MTEQNFKKVQHIVERLKELECVERKLEDENVYLNYATHLEYSTFPDYVINECKNYLKDILKKHDQMIRLEVKEEIKKLKEEIKYL